MCIQMTKRKVEPHFAAKNNIPYIQYNMRVMKTPHSRCTINTMIANAFCLF